MRPPASPQGKSTCGRPFMRRRSAFSGRPIFMPTLIVPFSFIVMPDRFFSASITLSDWSIFLMRDALFFSVGFPRHFGIARDLPLMSIVSFFFACGAQRVSRIFFWSDASWRVRVIELLIVLFSGWFFVAILFAVMSFVVMSISPSVFGSFPSLSPTLPDVSELSVFF